MIPKVKFYEFVTKICKRARIFLRLKMNSNLIKLQCTETVIFIKNVIVWDQLKPFFFGSVFFKTQIFWLAHTDNIYTIYPYWQICDKPILVDNIGQLIYEPRYIKYTPKTSQSHSYQFVRMNSIITTFPHPVFPDTIPIGFLPRHIFWFHLFKLLMLMINFIFTESCTYRYILYRE